MFFRKLFRKPEVNSGEVLVQKTQLRINDSDGIRRIIRHEMSKIAAAAMQAETFEEADDFELGDEEEWISPYEEVFDPEPEPGEGRSPSETAPAPPLADQSVNNESPSTPPST